MESDIGTNYYVKLVKEKRENTKSLITVMENGRIRKNKSEQSNMDSYILDQSLISVIVPAYNAEDVIEHCIESIVAQTYSNWEAIILNDGSKDNTKEIIQKWQKKDSRIIYVEHQNMGMGPTRNKGIKLAKGKYITFVDSDDWIEKEYIELLYRAIYIEQVDMSRCDFYLHDMLNEKIFTAEIKAPIDIEAIKTYQYPNVWSNMYDIDLFKKYNIEMLGIPLEDLAIYPLLVLLAERVACVEKPLYNYRINRGNSVMDNPENMKFFPDAITSLLEKGERLGLYDKYRKLFMEIALYHMNGTLQSRIKNNYSSEQFQKIKSEFIAFWSSKFLSDWREILDYNHYWIWGSYNISRIVANMNLTEGYNLLGKDSIFYYGFSSLISLFSNSEVSIKKKIFHENKMRSDMLTKDIDKSFRKILIEENEYLLIDFLEERYDIIEIGGFYITKSGAFDESDNNIKSYNIIDRNSEKCKKLWINACLCFVEMLREKIDCKKIVLLEIYLSPIIKMNNGKTAHWDGILEVNSILNEYYSFFKKHMPEAKVISVPPELNYTDMVSKYGNDPCYLNVIAHKEIGKKVKNYINNMTDI